MLTLSQSGAVNAALLLLIAFSAVTWFLILSKGWLQFQLGQWNEDFRARFWAAKSLDESEKLARGNQGTLARLVVVGFESLRSGERGGSLQQSGDRQEVLERSLRAQIQKEQHRLESGLMVLASIGSTAPFVGLFGTVWGIMNALKSIAVSGSAGIDVVAGPVGEALIATAIGIAVAIPSVLAYNYGVRTVRLMVADLERFGNDFMHLAMRSEYRLGD
jgi:biopolymer transport protein ExbB